MGYEEIIEDIQLEKTTQPIMFDIIDPATGLGFQPQTLTLTLWDVKTGAIINGRNGANVLSSVDAQGKVVFWLTEQDMQILDPTLVTEVHQALFTWTWLNGERHDGVAIRFHVYNHAKIS